MITTDSFIAPALDATKWNSTLNGTVYLDVGFPVDGVYVHGVDDADDSGVIDSENKIIIPGGVAFDAEVLYEGLYGDLVDNIYTFFGWRSLQKDLGGDPLNGIDVMIKVTPDPFYQFQKRMISWGVENRGDIIDDPNNGADGGFRMTRAGSDYSLFFLDGGSWTLLETINFSYNGSGFFVFGLFAEDPAIVFPWVVQS